MELHIPFEKHIAETGVLWRVVTSTALSATLLLASVLSNILLIHRVNREDRKMMLPWLVVDFGDSMLFLLALPVCFGLASTKYLGVELQLIELAEIAEFDLTERLILFAFVTFLLAFKMVAWRKVRKVCLQFQSKIIPSAA